jgi:capsular exopolysaccharide synthesis family protein
MHIQKDKKILVLDELQNNLSTMIFSLQDSLSKDLNHGFSLAFTSSHFNEGVSTIALNTALSFMYFNEKKIALIDANFETPSLHGHFNVENNKGFSDLILQKLDFEKNFLSVEQGKIQFLPSGKKPERLSMVFANPFLEKFVQYLKAKFDLIIFDLPPVFKFYDIVFLSQNIDGIILIIEAEKTRFEVAENSVKMLQKAGVNVFGSILNKKRHFIPDFIYTYFMHK